MVFRRVSISRDHPQGVCLYLAKVTELFEITRTLHSTWLQPYTVQRMALQGSQHTPATGKNLTEM